MNITIVRKMIFSFLSLSLMVIISGGTGIYMLKKVAASGEEVIEEKVPIKDVAMEAIISAEKALNGSRDYLGSEKDLSKIEEEIDKHLGYLNMWISMIKYGTASEEFNNSSAGKIYIKDKIKRTVPPGTDEMIALIDTINTHRSSFTNTARELIKIHNTKVEYTFMYKDVHYNLSAFLYTADNKHRKWVEGLVSSIKYNLDFLGESDPAKSFIGAWLASYQTSDEELIEKLKDFRSVYNFLYETAAQILESDMDNRASMLSHATPIFSKALNHFSDLEKYADEKISAIVRREKASVNAMFEASSKMTVGLEQLKTIADEGMYLAQENAKNSKASAQWMLMTLIVIAVIFALALGFIITKSIENPLTSQTYSFRTRVTNDDVRILMFEQPQFTDGLRVLFDIAWNQVAKTPEKEA